MNCEQDQTQQLFIFLDRDGTLIEEKNYLYNPDEVVLLPGVVSGLKKLTALGAVLIVVTNQSGIGRGYYTPGDMEAVNSRIAWLLQQEGIGINAFYHCPHSPEQNCSCRKPLIGMFEQARKNFHLDSGQLFMIGDKLADVNFGLNIGAQSILVLTGYGKQEEHKPENRANFIALDLAAAAEWIASHLSR